MDRAPACGADGCAFDSRRGHSFFKPKKPSKPSEYPKGTYSSRAEDILFLNPKKHQDRVSTPRVLIHLAMRTFFVLSQQTIKTERVPQGHLFTSHRGHFSSPPLNSTRTERVPQEFCFNSNKQPFTPRARLLSNRHRSPLPFNAPSSIVYPGNPGDSSSELVKLRRFFALGAPSEEECFT